VRGGWNVVLAVMEDVVMMEGVVVIEVVVVMEVEVAVAVAVEVEVELWFRLTARKILYTENRATNAKSRSCTEYKVSRQFVS
jgi:hypothetical protein